jgi:hypothetical protein
MESMVSPDRRILLLPHRVFCVSAGIAADVMSARRTRSTDDGRRAARQATSEPSIRSRCSRMVWVTS